MRLIRSRAAMFGIDPNRIGVVGFSAGGHLAGTIATEPDVSRYPPVDAADRVSARPDFAVLIYPVLTMTPPFDKTQARRQIIGENPTIEQAIAYSVEHHIDAKMPKTFLAQALDDPISPKNRVCKLRVRNVGCIVFNQFIQEIKQSPFIVILETRVIVRWN